MGRVLAGADVVGRVATRTVLGRASAGEPQGDALGSGTVRAGRLPPAGAGQRVAAASGMVRADRAGRSAGRRLRAGRDPQALSLPRPAAGAQTSAVRSSDGPLARPVQRPLRSLALRSDQHVFRGRAAVSRWRQAALRLFARPSARLRAGGGRAGGDAGRLAAGLRDPARQYVGQTTLRDFLERIERQYGKARRVWLMDRGIPTEETLAEMREADPPVRYLVGTPKGRLNRLERDLSNKPWQEARPGVQVKLLPQDGELYVFAQSLDRVAEERSMRRRQLKGLWARLKDLRRMSVNLTRDELLIKLGQAKAKWPTGWRLVQVDIDARLAAFRYALDRKKLRQTRRREGRYLLRSNLTEGDPATLWNYYLQLGQVEEAFRNLKGDLAIRPIHHQEPERIEAHIFIAFLAYCLHVTIGLRLKGLAPGLTPRSLFEKFAAVQMIDVHIPTTDGRELQLTRYTQPQPELTLLLNRLRLELPDQPPPKITAAEAAAANPV